MIFGESSTELSSILSIELFIEFKSLYNRPFLFKYYSLALAKSFSTIILLLREDIFKAKYGSSLGAFGHFL